MSDPGDPRGSREPAPTGEVHVRGLRHAFGATDVLDAVDLDVGAGEFVALLGPSGCGKSTLLRVLAGLLLPTSGTATIDGEDVLGHPGRAAFQPQRDALLPWRRVLGNAAVGAELAGLPPSEARARAAAVLDRFGLAGVERAWPAQLSGGMRQRVAVARTFLVGRAPLLLDEPFGALDALTRRDLYRWLEEVWESERVRRSTLLVTHDVDEALTLADRILVMSPRPGRIVASHPVPFPRPRHTALLAAPAGGEARATLIEALAR